MQQNADRIDVGCYSHVLPDYTGWNPTGYKDLTQDMLPDLATRISVSGFTTFATDADPGNWIYGVVGRFKILMTNISGNGNVSVKVEYQTVADYKAQVNTWTEMGTYYVAGWSGWNSIPANLTFGSSWTSDNSPAVVRFTFTQKTLTYTSGNKHACASVLRIQAMPKMVYTNGTTARIAIANTGMPYVIEYNGDVTFGSGCTIKAGTNGSLVATTVTASGITGTLPIEHGGTGQTTAKAAEYALTPDLATDKGDWVDAARLACIHTSASATNGRFVGYRTASSLWTYINKREYRYINITIIRNINLKSTPSIPCMISIPPNIFFKFSVTNRD
jgi:hypothetical protein